MNSTKTNTKNYAMVKNKAIAGIVLVPEKGQFRAYVAWEWEDQAMQGNFAIVEGTETIELSKFKKQIFDYTESFKFNKVVSSFMILFNENKNKELTAQCKNDILDLLEIYMPSIREKC